MKIKFGKHLQPIFVWQIHSIDKPERQNPEARLPAAGLRAGRSGNPGRHGDGFHAAACD